jgi:hypothetical protein
MTTKLFTIFLSFSDHTNGVGQHKAETSEDALKEFIRHSESLVDYDRSLLLKSILPLIHITPEKGVWLFTFDPDLIDLEWPGDNPVLGGYIVQTEPDAPSRSRNT